MKELKSYKMTDGGTMVLSLEGDQYLVEQFTAGDISRWYKRFDKASEADTEYERWRGHAAGS